MKYTNDAKYSDETLLSAVSKDNNWSGDGKTFTGVEIENNPIKASDRTDFDKKTYFCVPDRKVADEVMYVGAGLETTTKFEVQIPKYDIKQYDANTGEFTVI